MNEKILYQQMIKPPFWLFLPPHLKASLEQGVEKLLQRMKDKGFSSVYSTSKRKGAEIHFLLDDEGEVIEEGWIKVTKYRNNRTIINFSYVKSRELINYILEVIKIQEVLHSNTGNIELLIPKDETRVLCVRGKRKS
jgi:hypothetical protein